MLGVKLNWGALTAPDVPGERYACICQEIRDLEMPKTNSITTRSTLHAAS